MIKVTLLLGAILVLCTAAVIKTAEERNLVEGCESEDELWGSEDGTKFYFCIGDNMAIEQSCEPDTFFVKNATVSGCVPLDEVADSCVYHVEPEPCEGINLLQPQPHTDPTMFYLCTESGADPVALPCPDNNAFAKQDGYLGCFDWAMWRKIRGCDPKE
ncbi:uncharacterized protein LOC111674563 [Lucilia cuprina]|uniref:uncharacterized protein LOC111674563 n=1 Tax=Lucilia cuprina TaxID=7375 RepID=UPI001F059855|nr:uncharacterized protein LOC111674563 [Lucilia cuprina]